MGKINDVLAFLDPYGPVKKQNVPKAAESYKCCCPVCGDKNDKLSVSEMPDGRVLLNCWRGHSAGDVLRHIGKTTDGGDIDWSFLFPEQERHIHRMESVFGPRPSRKRTLDDHMLAVAAADRKRGARLSEADKLKEFEAFKRIQERGY